MRMPGIVVFRRRWSVGSDDLVVPGTFLATLHFIWAVILVVIYTVVRFDTNSQCVTSLRQHVLGYIIIMSCCVVIEACIACLSMRGTILNTGPRRGMQYLVYVRLVVFVGELIWLVTGVVWIAQNYTACDASMAKKALLGVVICNWVILFSVLLASWCTFDSGGRSWVKLKRYQESLKERENRPGHKRRSGSRRRNWRHSLLVKSLPYRKAIRMYERSWDKRCRFLFCCVGRDRHQGSFAEVARLFTDFFRDLDVVPSDVVAGLVLLRNEQKRRRFCIVQQQTNEVYQFLSGIPISPSTKFLSLRNPDELAEFKRVIHFMHYALAAYGWPMYMMTHAGTGLCKIMPGLSCCCCGCHGHGENPDLHGDNCCDCNLAALHKLLKLNKQACSVVYCTYHCDIGETPFFVALDHEHKRVVVAIRGTLSLQDVLTDLKAESEPIPIDPIREDWLGHKGMVQAAVYIRKQIRELQLLHEAFSHDTDRGTQDYELTIVGHSLGAGAAAILAILLQQEYPGLHCFAFSPPGGLLSAPCVEETKSFITSVVVGKDVVPRIGLYQLETLRQDLITVIKKSEKPKWRIIANSLCWCSEKPSKTATTPEAVSMYEQVRAQRETRYFTHPTDSAIALTSHVPLYPPGNVIHVVRTHPDSSGFCQNEEPIYQAVWATNMDFDEVLISPNMVNDHMPENVLDALKKVLTNASPAKPTRKYTEAERQAMLSHDHDNQMPPSNYHSNHIATHGNHSKIPVISHPHFNFDIPTCNDTIVPVQSGYLESRYAPDSHKLSLLDNDGNNPGMAYCIPAHDPTTYNSLRSNGVGGNVMWDLEQGVRFEPGSSPRPQRPRSFPPKPRPMPLRLDLQQSIADWPTNAPLATPETLSEASSMTSVNSRGSWRGGMYQRMSSEVSTLAPIQQSPVRPTRAQVLAAFNNTSPVTLHTSSISEKSAPPPISGNAIPAQQISSPSKALHSSDSNSSPKLQNAHMPCHCSVENVNTNQQNNMAVHKSNQPVTNDYICHSPDSTKQLPYDWINGGYSHGGRGYPHGHCKESGAISSGNDLTHGYAHNIEGIVAFTPENEIGESLVNIESITNSELENICRCNHIKLPNGDAKHSFSCNEDLSKNTPVKQCYCAQLKAIHKPPSIVYSQPSPDASESEELPYSQTDKKDIEQSLFNCEQTSDAFPSPQNENIPLIYCESCKEAESNELIESHDLIGSQDLVERHDPSRPHHLSVPCDFDDTPEDDLDNDLDESRGLDKSRDVEYGESREIDESNDMRDDVSCSDSEPFMPQGADSDSATSPLFPLLRSGLFVQESQV